MNMNFKNNILIYVSIILFFLISYNAGIRLFTSHYLYNGQFQSEAALRLAVNALRADLARYEIVPNLIADIDVVRELASRPQDPALKEEANAWLKIKNDAIESDALYVISSNGITISSSNYLDKSDSFVGKDFSFRPYFMDALRGEPGRFFGVGTATGVRGYFFSAPVRNLSGEVIAVVAVKVGVDRFEAAWQDAEYRFLVTDPEGVTFLSSVPSWRYGSLGPLLPENLSHTSIIRRYADLPLREIGLEEDMAFGVPVLRERRDGARAASAREYIAVSQEMPEAGWTVHVLLDDAGLRANGRLATLALLMLFCALGLLGGIVLQRRKQVRERLAMQDRATVELEHRVKARTSELRQTNIQLEQEIAERRATETALRTAQAHLVEVGRLAALGQMSAAFSHEINQPLAAARNYADNAQVLLAKGQTARVQENIGRILMLLDRIAAIGRHLRDAARKPDDQIVSLSLAALLDETRAIVDVRLAGMGAMLEMDIPADLPNLRAGPTRLQQVLVNLITNAADAIVETDDRRITLTARADQGEVSISIRDRGPGVPEAIAGRIFDPFFTTKRSGAGLGLGLSITAGILRDLGGSISVLDAAPGAIFTVRLPAADSSVAAA